MWCQNFCLYDFKQGVREIILSLIKENFYSNVMKHLPFISVFVVQVQNL